MKPIILQGHSRPIKDIKFNKDSDLIFTASSDRLITLWASETGERIGTFEHSAAINNITLTQDSKILISGDNTGISYFWEVSTGKLLKKIETEPYYSVRSCDLSYGDKMVAISFGGRNKDSESYVNVYNIDDILKAETNEKKTIKRLEPFKEFKAKSSKYITSKWINTNKNLVCTKEDGSITMIDFETKEILREKKIHSETIQDMDISKKGEIILTASKDGKAQVLNPDTFDIIHTLHPKDPTRNLNSCKISPLFSCGDENEEKFHALLAGGQESRDVTTTHAKKGGFELLFYNLMYGEELGAIQGHFGPVNTVAFSPNGEIVASGAEDSTVRVHKLDEEYYSLDK
jgi:translation initiation factor 3 subunit I